MSSGSTTSLNQANLVRSSWWVLLAALYVISGLTSLAFEVLWARMLSMQFGISIFGVVITVAAFMLGLGMGSFAGTKWARQSAKPLALFAMLESGIAVYALLLPGLLQAGGTWLEGNAAQLTWGQWHLLQGLEALCLLVIPAFAMGAGFALVLKASERTPLTLGKLYGFNTLGGVLGALLPLWSLPALGWGASVKMVAMLGLLVGVMAYALSRQHPCETSLATPGNKVQQAVPLRELLIYAGIGAASITLEIGWVRLYGMVMLRTEYVLGVILAVFLLGIALGSLLLPYLRKFRLSVWLPFLASTGVLLSVYLLPMAATWIEHGQFQSLVGAMWAQALLLGFITLPATLALGAWLPLLAERLHAASTGGAWLYGANCLGGAIGAVAACLLGIPLLGSVAVVVLAGLVITALGLMGGKPRALWLGFVALLLAALPLRNMPPVHQLLPMIEGNSQDLYLYEDAIALSHVVRHPDGQRLLLTDLQRMDASTDPAAVEIQKDQARLALLLHPAPQEVLFLGIGTGISAAGSQPFPGLQRNAVEISQGAIAASRTWFAEVNGGIMDRMQVQHDDARHYLDTTQHRYDVIIGDLFHPDLAGLGSLLSVQQFQRARSHLKEGGLFVQWLALNQFDIASLQVVLRSFRKVFPEAQLFMDGMHVALVGPENKLGGAKALLGNLQRMATTEQSQATGSEGGWTWLGRYWGPLPESAGAVQDEWKPYIEFNLPLARYAGQVDLVALLNWLLQQHPAPDIAMQLLGIDAGDKKLFGRAYVATELMARGWIASIQGDVQKAGELTWLAYQANPQDRWIANALADNMLQSLAQASQHGLSQHEALQRILKVAPENPAVLRMLWRLEQSAGNQPLAEEYRLKLLAVSPLDTEANAGKL